MIVRVRKWGNSLALRIPAPFAEDTGIHSGSEVDLEMEDGRLVITPRAAYRLDELLAGVNEDNLHDAIETGPPEGREAW